MSNASLKEQLEAVVSQMTAAIEIKPPKKKVSPPEKKPKPKWLDYVQYGVLLLKVYFPETFKDMNSITPLKIGIKHDLIKKLSTLADIVTEDKACMVKSLSYYVSTMNYHKCMIEGTTRIDLEGKPSGQVTAEEAKYSQDCRLKLQVKRDTHLPSSSS